MKIFIHKFSLEKILIILSAAIIILHATLIPLARWHPDEFLFFANYSASGWRAVAERIFGWSPRPISEIFLFAYYLLVTWAQSPVPAVVIGLSWASVLAILVLASRVARVGIALPMSIMAAAILVTRPGEMWFWTAAALAYLPSFAGIGAAAILMVGSTRGRLHNMSLAGSLLLAAGSSELGALAVFTVTAGLFVRTLAGRCGLLRPAEIAAWAWMIPALLSTAVLASLALGRMGSEAEAFGNSEVRGHLIPSLFAAAKVSWPIFAGISVEPHGRRVVWLGIIFKAALVFGFWAIAPNQPRSRERIIEKISFAIAVFLLHLLLCFCHTINSEIDAVRGMVNFANL